MRQPSLHGAESVNIPAGEVDLPGHLLVPPSAGSLVVFVHGGGSSRHSPRNMFVADCLVQEGFGFLLFDLLTEEEKHEYAAHFDIDRIAARLLAVTRWLQEFERTRRLRIGYFGTGTGVAAALRAVAELAEQEGEYLVSCVVSRGGRPDLVLEYLPEVSVPVLLIVNEADGKSVRRNESARARLGGQTDLEKVPDAGRRFEEPGALDRVAELSRRWFHYYLLQNYR